MTNEEVQGHIDRAQGFRRDARRLLDGGDADAARRKFDEALGAIRDGLERLEREEPPDSSDPTDEDRDTAKLFADLYGIRGGTHRDMIPLDQEHRARAIRAYDAGAKYERDFALKSTYNFVNQLVLRFLDQPDLLTSSDKPLTIDTRGERSDTDAVSGWLRRAEEHVTRSLPRRDDRAWALADLTLLAALQSSDDLDAYLARFEHQVASDHDIYPYKSLLLVVRDLVHRTKPHTPKTLGHLHTWLVERTTGQ